MSVNFEQKDVSHSYVKVAVRPKYKIQKLHFAMNNPVLETLRLMCPNLIKPQDSFYSLVVTKVFETSLFKFSVKLIKM